MWRRVAIALVLAALGVVAFVVLLVRSDVGGRNLCALAEATLREVSRERVVIGRCHVDPITTRVVIEGVEIGPAGRPLLAADRIAAGLEPKGLLSGRVRVDGVEIVRPRIDADLSQPSKSAEVEPRRPRGAACLPALGPLEVGTVTVVGGDLRLLLPGGRVLASEGLELSVRGSGARLELGVAAARTSFVDGSTEAIVERTQLKAEVDLESGFAKLSSLDVSAREGSVYAQAEFTSLCTPRGRASATIHVDLGRAGETLLRRVPKLGGRAIVRARARIDGGRFDATADVQVRDATVLDFVPGDFDLVARAEPGRVTLERFELPLATGRVRAKGSLALEAPFAAAVEAELENFSLGELMQKLGHARFPVHLVASGTARLAGPLAGPTGPVLAGAVDARVGPFGVFDGTWQERASRQRFVGFERGTLKSALVLSRDRLLLRGTQIRAGDTALAANGLVHFDSRRGLQLEVDAPEVSLSDLAPFGPVDCAGRGALSGTVEGPYRGLDIRASTSLRDVRVMGLELGSIATQARLDLAHMTLDVPAARGLKGRSTYEARGHLDLAAGPALDARLELKKARAQDLAMVARSLAPAIAALEGRADAIVDGSVEVRGPAQALDIDAELSLLDIDAFGQFLPRGTISASLVDGARVELRRLKVERGDGHLTVKGRLDIPERSYSLSVSTAGLYVRDLDHLSRALPGLTGGVTLRGRGAGTLDDPRLDLNLTLRDWRLGAQPLFTVRLGLALDGRDASVEGTIASPWPKETKPPPRAPGAPYPLPPDSMFHELRAQARLDGDLPFSLDMTLDVPKASALLPPGRMGDVRAGLEGRLHANGLLARPLTIEALLELPRLWAQKGRTRIENSRPAVVSLESGRVSLQALPLRGPSFQLDAYGVRELDGRLDFTLEGGADLGLLRELVPSLDEARGRVDVELALGGTQAEPIVVGNAQLDGVAIRPRGAPVEVTDGHGSVSFSPEAVVVDGLEARLNGGPVAIGGHVELDKFRPQRLELRAELGEIPLRIDDVPVVIAGAPVLTGTLDALALGGELELVRLRFERDVELERIAVRALELLRRPPAPKVFSRSGEFLSLDLGVRLGDVGIDNNLAKADLRGELRVTGTNRRPGLLGAVTIVDGRAFFRNNEFVLSSGVVNFTDRTRIRPAFDVRADAQVREYLVHVSASGTAQDQRVLLSSEPPLSQADIVTLLTIGVTSRDFDRTGSASIGGVLLDAAYNASGLNEQLRQLLPETELLKDAQFRVTSAYNELSGNIEPVAQFESKLWRDELKLRGQTSLLGGRGKRAQLEYRWNDNFSAQLQWDADNPNAPTIGDLGGDLKLHQEWP